MYLFCQAQLGNINQRGWVGSLQTEAVVFCEGATASERLQEVAGIVEIPVNNIKDWSLRKDRPPYLV